MKRAAVVLAVMKTANPQLQTLRAAASSAEQVVGWAKAQGFAVVERLTDESGPLEVRTIKQTVRAIVEDGTFEQLFVYFSGHGVNLGRNEYWLLSGAPTDPQESVNVTASADLARYCGIPHVVFVSDACRTPASGLQAQVNVGSQIFPNLPVTGPENQVDMFFACLLGDPALEIPDRDKGYTAVYTETLVQGLRCEVPACREEARVDGQPGVVVRAWPLRDYLMEEVPWRLQAAGVAATLTQVPDARITSPPRAWLAHKTLPAGGPAKEPPAPGPVPSDPISLLRLTPERMGMVPHPDEERQVRAWRFIDLVRAVEPGLTRDDGPLERAGATVADLFMVFRTEAEARAGAFERVDFETGCGFAVRGTTLAEVFHPGGRAGLDGAERAWVRPEGPTNVVLRFGNGTGTVLPAIPGFVAELSVEGGELVNVVYEPASGTARRQEYDWEIHRLRRLRGQIAAASRLGIFQPVGEGVGQLAREMQSAKSLDPTMALYAAYAYYAVQETRKVAEMEAYLAEDLKFRFFDLALLARMLERATPEPVLPRTPLLSQGWALLSVRNVTLPAHLERLPACLTSSLWSTFNLEGVEMLKQALNHGELSP